jgi:hypothetical protein
MVTQSRKVAFSAKAQKLLSAASFCGAMKFLCVFSEVFFGV